MTSIYLFYIFGKLLGILWTWPSSIQHLYHKRMRRIKIDAKESIKFKQRHAFGPLQLNTKQNGDFCLHA